MTYPDLAILRQAIPGGLAAKMAQFHLFIHKTAVVSASWRDDERAWTYIDFEMEKLKVGDTIGT